MNCLALKCFQYSFDTKAVILFHTLQILNCKWEIWQWEKKYPENRQSPGFRPIVFFLSLVIRLAICTSRYVCGMKWMLWRQSRIKFTLFSYFLFDECRYSMKRQIHEWVPVRTQRSIVDNRNRVRYILNKMRFCHTVNLCNAYSVSQSKQTKILLRKHNHNQQIVLSTQLDSISLFPRKSIS